MSPTVASLAREAHDKLCKNRDECDGSDVLAVEHALQAAVGHVRRAVVAGVRRQRDEARDAKLSAKFQEGYRAACDDIADGLEALNAEQEKEEGVEGGTD